MSKQEMKVGGGGTGGRMARKKFGMLMCLAVLGGLAALPASAQSFRVQCPTSTITHPDSTTTIVNSSEPTYDRPISSSIRRVTSANGDRERRDQVPAGFGWRWLFDNGQWHADIHVFFRSTVGTRGHREWPAWHGVPGGFQHDVHAATSILMPGDPATTDGMMANTWTGYPLPTSAFTWNGAVGLAKDTANLVSIYDIAEDPGGKNVTVQTNAPLGLKIGDSVTISGTGTGVTGYDSTWIITSVGTVSSKVTNYGFPAPTCLRLTPRRRVCRT